jgi:hypothetical protein
MFAGLFTQLFEKFKNSENVILPVKKKKFNTFLKVDSKHH